jgi:hypothetical protein
VLYQKVKKPKNSVTQKKKKEKLKKFLPDIEPGTFCVLGRRDIHYTTETDTLKCSSIVVYILNDKIMTKQKCCKTQK